MACILFWSSAVRVHNSQAYRKMDVTRERISRILEQREILLSIQIGFSLVNAAVACAIQQSNSGLEPSSVITEPRYWKLVTRLSGLAKTILEGTVKGGRRQGRQRKRWEDNIRKTGRSSPSLTG